MFIDGEYSYDVHQRIIINRHGISSGVPWNILDRRLKGWYEEKIVPLDIVHMSRILELSKAAKELKKKWELCQTKRIGVYE